MSMLTTLPAPRQATGSQSAAPQMAYRRLAAAILGLDVRSLAADLRIQRTVSAPEAPLAERKSQVLA